MREQMVKMVDEELLKANKNFPLFQSPHEGYAVLLEEVEEVEAEITWLRFEIEKLWRAVKENDKIDDTLKMIDMYGTWAAEELIQVLAMVRKFELSRGGWK